MRDLQVDVRRFTQGFERISNSLARAAEQLLRAGVTATEESAKGTTLFSDRSGETRGSIRGEVVGPALGFVRAGGAAGLLQSGTRPHRITAGGGVLRFVVNGQTVFAKSVEHPGTAPRPFMTEAREAGERAIERAVPFHVGEALGRTG